MASVNETPRGPRRSTSARSDSHDRIVAAAHRLFLDRGFAGTTIEAIAVEAGVAVQTIYNVVGVKSAVLEAVLDIAAAGVGSPGSVRQIMERRTADAADLASLVGVLAEWFIEVHGRTAEVFRVIRDAAAVDADIAALDRRRARVRFDNYTLAAAALASRRGADPVDSEALAAGIWSIGSPQTYRFLVLEQRWSVDRYRRWVVSTLTALVTGGNLSVG